MKLAKLSLAAIVVAGLASSSFAADTLADAFKEGKVTGALKAYYFSADDGSNRESILNTGLMLNYKTGSFYGFGANFTGQTNHAPFASSDAKVAFDGYEYGSGAQLSEAYLSYVGGKTTVLVGRMFLDTPLVASSGAAMVKQAFEGAAVINTDLPNTTLIAGYVQRFQTRTDGNGKIGQFTKLFSTGSIAPVTVEDGAYTLAAINKSIEGLTLTGAYANANDLIQIVYAEALYEGKASNFGYTLGAQYYGNKLDSSVGSVDDKINAFGLKAGASVGSFNAYVAYSKISNDNYILGGLVSGLGGGADLLYTDSVILSGTYGNNAESYAVDVNYDITKAANVGARYVVVDNDAVGGNISYTGFYANYAFDGALKGFTLGAEYDKAGKDGDGDELRVRAIYKF